MSDRMQDLPDDWTEEQNALFTKVYKFMLVSQSGMIHPQARIVNDENWGCVCFNAAYAAAELLVYDSLRVIDVDTDQTIAESPGALNS